APAPQPRRSHPRPAEAGAEDVLVRRAVAVGAFGHVLAAVRHPDPAVLMRVDPLPAGVRGPSLRSGSGRILQDADGIVILQRWGGRSLQDADGVVIRVA